MKGRGERFLTSVFGITVLMSKAGWFSILKEEVENEKFWRGLEKTEQMGGLSKKQVLHLR